MSISSAEQWIAQTPRLDRRHREVRRGGGADRSQDASYRSWGVLYSWTSPLHDCLCRGRMVVSSRWSHGLRAIQSLLNRRRQRVYPGCHRQTTGKRPLSELSSAQKRPGQLLGWHIAMYGLIYLCWLCLAVIVRESDTYVTCDGFG